MARVVLELSSLLADVLGVRTLELEAESARAALHAAAEAVPGLATHLFDGRGEPRRHVLCLVNEHTARGAALDAPLADGDRVRVHQAISGG